MILMVAEMIEELKTIKIKKTAHRALELAKAFDGIKQQEWVSAVILEAIQRDCPKAYETLREETIREK